MFWADGPDEALREAIAGAEAAARMGKALREGDSITSQATKLKSDPKPPVFEFVGFIGPRSVGNHLDHGTEVDRYDLSRRTKGGLPPKGRLMAFDPSGPVYTGDARSDHNQELFRKYQWYLAEEMFEIAAGSPRRQGQTSIVRGSFVFLHAPGPEEAYDLAMADGRARQVGTDVQTDGVAAFMGLRQLSLITDDVANRVCMLRTDEYWTTIARLRKVIQTRPELDALVFR